MLDEEHAIHLKCPQIIISMIVYLPFVAMNYYYHLRIKKVKLQSFDAMITDDAYLSAHSEAAKASRATGILYGAGGSLALLECL